MASEVSISNLALSHLGDAATVASIDPPEGSAQSEHCMIFYPIARDSLLEMHDWNFATRRTKLALLDLPVWSWRFAYARPKGCLRAISLLGFHCGTHERGEDFESESVDDDTQVILTNLPDATLRYTARVEDPTKFSPLFVDALSWLLASYLAGPVIKGDTGAAAGRAAYQTFLIQLRAAIKADASQRQIDPWQDEHAVPWMRGR